MAEETAEEKAAREKQEAEEAERKANEEKSRKKPWGSDEEFDPEKAWTLIENLRKEVGTIKADRDHLKAKAQEIEDAKLGEKERAEKTATEATQRAAKAEADAARLRVALKKGLTETQAKRLVGESEEDLEKDADELLESFKKEEDDDAPRRPRERLRPGAAPGAEPEKSDPASLAAEVPRGW